MELKNLALTPEDLKEEYSEGMGIMAKPYEESDAPKYPYGLEVRLEDESLSKLGMDSLPEVGTEVMITAKAKVTSVSLREDQSGSDKCLCLQITDMSIGDVEAPKKSPEESLYGA